MENNSVVAKTCVTSCSHEAERPNELSFEQGDLVTLASELNEDGEHYQAVAADGSMGLIHHSAILERPPIPMWEMPWFHGPISRLDAEKLLDRNRDGQFLLRTSQNTKGVYALAISHEGKVNHYLVAMDFSTKKLTINGERYFDHLPQLVQVHSEDPGSLGCCLTHPLTRRGVLDYYIDIEPLKNIWGLPKSDMELGEALGHGEFGEVCLATYRGMQVAAKVIHEDKQSANNTASFLHEAAILTHLQHQNLVQIVGVVFQGSAMKCILTEVMGKGSLQKYLISRGRSIVSQQELLSFARDVCEGMVYMSSRGFVHRDLAARNVLLNSNGQAKISDFGLARKADLFVPHEGGKFPVKWTAPEALKESKFSLKSDVWSFGILLWEIYSYGRTPYPSVPTTEVLENIEDGLIMDPPDHCSDEIYDMMCICWEIEPERRPTFLSLQLQLTRASADSCTPNNSPMVPRRPFPAPNIDQLVSGPVAVQAYREAPVSRKATMFLGNIILLGYQGSGKTSLLRSLTGEAFRLVEPPSQQVDISENYCLLTENLNWVASVTGLGYEDELVRIILEDLLRHMNSSFSKSGANALEPIILRSGDHPPPPLPPLAVRPGGYPPPLPPLLPQRSQSFSETNLGAKDSRDRSLSGSFDTDPSQVKPNVLRPAHLSSPRGKRSRIAKFLNKNFMSHHSKDHKRVQRHHSDSAQHMHYTNHCDASTSTPGNSSPLLLPPRFSPLPERLTDRIKEEFDHCTGGALPPKYLARVIDTPGHPSFRVLQSLYLTENSLCLLVFDASKDILSPPSASSLALKRKPSPEVKQNGRAGHPPGSLEDSYLLHIMAEVSNICVQWSGCNVDMTICGPRIVIVGTHSDKVSSNVTHRNFDILREEIRASPYQRYVANVKFVVSNSSIIERSSMDELKRFMKENIKKSCRQQVPLKWLRCVRRFRAYLKKGNYFVSLADARKLVSEICDISPAESEIDEVIEFLHRNQVIMHFSRVHHLRDLVISSSQWFMQHVSALFGAAFVGVTAELGTTATATLTPAELAVQQELLRSTGILSNQLLDHVWRAKDSRANRDKLLTIMNKMDLLCSLASETATNPAPSLSASVEDLTAEPKRSKHRQMSATPSLVIPALVEEDPDPAYISSLPEYDVDPVLFRFKDHVPNGLFPRLLVRCVQSYPKGFTLYRQSATFQVDDKSLLLLREGRNDICLSLHPLHKTTPLGYKVPSSPTNQYMSMSDFDSDSVNPFVCMAVLMFVQTSISDLTQQWTPHLDFDLCVKCTCKFRPIPMDAVVDIDDALAEMSRNARSRLAPNKVHHYVILNDVDSLVQQLPLRCELGNQVNIDASLLCWFGEVPAASISPTSPLGDIEYVTDEDVSQVVKVLGHSWMELGQTLGFSQLELERFSLTSQNALCAGMKMLEEWQTLHKKNATFFALLGALEIIQRRDIADELSALRTVQQ